MFDENMRDESMEISQDESDSEMFSFAPVVSVSTERTTPSTEAPQNLGGNPWKPKYLQDWDWLRYDAKTNVASCMYVVRCKKYYCLN
jgi:hypothetical protein